MAKAKKERPDFKSYIGGTDSGPIMGMSKWKSRTEVWEEKTGRVAPPDLSNNQAVQWGLKLEKIIRQEAEVYLGRKITVPGFRLSKVLPYAGGHIDGMFSIERTVALSRIEQQKAWGKNKNQRTRKEKERHLVELKSGNSWVYKDGLPDYIEFQCRHYMHVWDSPICHVLVFLMDKKEFLRFDVVRDMDVERKMLDEYVKFWTHVQQDTAPTPMTVQEAIAQDIQIEGFGHADYADIQTVAEVAQLKAEIKERQATVAELEELLKSSLISKNCEGLQHEDKPLVTWREVLSNRLDTKRLKAEKPELVKEYTTETSTRTLRYAR